LCDTPSSLDCVLASLDKAFAGQYIKLPDIGQKPLRIGRTRRIMQLSGAVQAAAKSWGDTQ